MTSATVVPVVEYSATVTTDCSTMVKKDIEIQPGFEPGSSEFRSDALTNELLELWHWSRFESWLDLNVFTISCNSANINTFQYCSIILDKIKRVSEPLIVKILVLGGGGGGVGMWGRKGGSAHRLPYMLSYNHHSAPLTRNIFCCHRLIE